jgi:hypothetical protein
MPKKPGVARARKQSSKPKTRKSIELVHSRIPPGQAAQQETDEKGDASLHNDADFRREEARC